MGTWSAVIAVSALLVKAMIGHGLDASQEVIINCGHVSGSGYWAGLHAETWNDKNQASYEVVCLLSSFTLYP